MQNSLSCIQGALEEEFKGEFERKMGLPWWPSG